MHTVTIKSITETICTVSSTDPDNSDPHQLMGKVGYSIEQLDVIFYSKSYPASQNWMKYLDICLTVVNRIDQFPLVLAQKLCMLNNILLTVQLGHIWSCSMIN